MAVTTFLARVQMDGWMSGLVDDLIGGWLGGCVSWWVGECVVELVGGWMDGQIGWWVGVWVYGWTVG